MAIKDFVDGVLPLSSLMTFRCQGKKRSVLFAVVYKTPGSVLLLKNLISTVWIKSRLLAKARHASPERPEHFNFGLCFELRNRSCLLSLK